MFRKRSIPPFLLLAVLASVFLVLASPSFAWNTTTIVDNGGSDNSTAVDKNNKVHISYRSKGTLKYATNASGKWVAQTLDSNSYGDVGWYTSIAVDLNNKVHISYFDMELGVLKYATNASGSWVIQTVDPYGDVGWYSSLAVDSSNKAHISYWGYVISQIFS